MNAILDYLSSFTINNPFDIVVLLLRNGALIILFPLFVKFAWDSWHIYINELYHHHKKPVLLAIDVPKLTEQSMKAIEQIITALHGVHNSPDSKQKHWGGFVQDSFSLEIVSIEGYIQYFIRCDAYSVDLVKAAVFAQYPDAEIIEVEDYVKNVPSHFPNPTHDMWGCEFVLSKPGMYPIKTYEHFEHSLSGTFADPLSDLLETLNRIRPGEQVWIQMLITPEGDHFREHAQHELDALIGKEHAHGGPGVLERIADAPIRAFGALSDAVLNDGGTGGAAPAHPAAPPNTLGNYAQMSAGEQIVIQEVQKKLSRLVFETKIRFVYLAPQGALDPGRVVLPTIGAFKQFNALDLNQLVIDGHNVTAGPVWFRVQQRINTMKNHIMHLYKHRNNEEGAQPFVMSTVELATLFHFPTENVRAPLVSKTESKKVQAPSRLPTENQFQQYRIAVQQPSAHETADSHAHDATQSGEKLDTGVAHQGPLHSMKGLPPGIKAIRTVENDHVARRSSYIPAPPGAPAAVPQQPSTSQHSSSTPPNLPL